MFYVSILAIQWIYCYDCEFLKGNISLTCQDKSPVRQAVHVQKQNTGGIIPHCLAQVKQAAPQRVSQNEGFAFVTASIIIMIFIYRALIREVFHSDLEDK